MKKINFIALMIVVSVMFSCNRRTVQRIDPNKQVDLSGRWNDSDSKLVSQEMISDVLSRPWKSEYVQKTSKKPVVIVGDIKNRTSELIEPETFIKDLEREFINSGQVRLVQSVEFREQMRSERADQQEFASPETIKKWKKELGADFMLNGTINSIVDQYGKDKVIFYQVNLELSDLETNEKVWLGEKKIKKLINN